MYTPASISLTGATGQLGVAFLSELARRSPHTELRLLVRSDSTSFRDARFQTLLQRFSRVRLVFGDVANLNLRPDEAKMFAGAEGGVWHFAASTNLRTGEPDIARRAEAVNVRGTQNIVELCERASVRRFYHLSTAFVAGLREGLVREEPPDMRTGFHNSYEQTKAAAEEIVRAAFASGLNGIIIRPSLVVDTDGAAAPRSLPHVLAGALWNEIRSGREVVSLPLPHTAAINIVPQRFVVAALLALAELPCERQTYHLTAREPTCLRQIAEAFQAISPQLRLIYEPGSASTLLARMLHELRGYWTSSVTFDRSRLDRDVRLSVPDTIDWREVLERELQAVSA